MCYQTAVMASPDLSSWILRLDHPRREGPRRKPGRTAAYLTGERLSLGKPPLLYQAVGKPLLCPRRRHHGCLLQTQTERFYGWPITLALRSLLSPKPCPPYFLPNGQPDVIETGSAAFPKSNTSSFPILAASSHFYAPKHRLILNIFLSHQLAS